MLGSWSARADVSGGARSYLEVILGHWSALEDIHKADESLKFFVRAIPSRTVLTMASLPLQLSFPRRGCRLAGFSPGPTFCCPAFLQLLAKYWLERGGVGRRGGSSQGRFPTPPTPLLLVCWQAQGWRRGGDATEPRPLRGRRGLRLSRAPFGTLLHGTRAACAFRMGSTWLPFLSLETRAPGRGHPPVRDVHSSADPRGRVEREVARVPSGAGGTVARSGRPGRLRVPSPRPARTCPLRSRLRAARGPRSRGRRKALRIGVQWLFSKCHGIRWQAFLSHCLSGNLRGSVTFPAPRWPPLSSAKPAQRMSSAAFSLSASLPQIPEENVCWT